MCITGCREIYRISPSFCRKGRQFLHAVAFFGPLGGQIDTKFGLEVEIINICVFKEGIFNILIFGKMVTILNPIFNLFCHF